MSKFVVDKLALEKFCRENDIKDKLSMDERNRAWNFKPADYLKAVKEASKEYGRVE